MLEIKKTLKDVSHSPYLKTLKNSYTQTVFSSKFYYKQNEISKIIKDFHVVFHHFPNRKPLGKTMVDKAKYRLPQQRRYSGISIFTGRCFPAISPRKSLPTTRFFLVRNYSPFDLSSWPARGVRIWITPSGRRDRTQHSVHRRCYESKEGGRLKSKIKHTKPKRKVISRNLHFHSVYLFFFSLCVSISSRYRITFCLSLAAFIISSPVSPSKNTSQLNHVH